MNPIVTHEHFLEYGGGEYVATELAKTFDTKIVTGAITEGNAPDDVDVDAIAESWLGRKLTQYRPLVRDAYYFTQWPNVDLQDYDVVIQSGNNPTWYVPRDDQVVVKYVHSTPRTSYDLYHHYNEGDVASTLYHHVVRALYHTTVPYPDLYVANSELVARRINQYFGVPKNQIRVVYPPVDTQKYSPHHCPTGDYYFTWGRLHRHKNTRLLVKAFNELDAELIIGGTGPQEDSLRELAAENVHLRGWVETADLKRLVSGAKAVLFAGENEDFGLVPVESMAAGTPVLGIQDGFTQYQIRDGENGYTFEKSTRSLRSTVDRFDRHGVEWTPSEIEGWADEHFNRDRFQREIQEVVREARESARIQTGLHQ